MAQNPVVSIIDISGKIKQLEFTQRRNTIEFDVRSLTQGLYFVQVIDNDTRETYKLLKQ